MDLRPLTRSVQDQLVAGAALGDDATRQAAQLLMVSLEPALRLALQDAIGQVAAEVSAELAPGRVDLAIAGAELEVRVVPPSSAPQQPPAPPHPGASFHPGAPPHPGTPPHPGAPPAAEAPVAPSADPDLDASASRVTFRPPQHLKARLERAAAEESLSLNTYLVRALTAHLDQPAPTAPSFGAGRTSGWFL